MTPLDPTEAPEGYAANHAPEGCTGCAFEVDNHACSWTPRGTPCSQYARKDRTSVIFKKIDTPAVDGRGARRSA